MTREDILSRIGSILDELKTECRSLYIQSSIQPVDLELFEANANFLKEHVLILKKIVDKENVVVPSLSKEIHTPSVSIDELLIKEDKSKVEHSFHEEQPVVDEAVKAELKLEEKPKVAEDLKKIETEAEPISIAEPEVAPLRTVEVEQEPVLSADEKIKKEEEAWAEINRQFQTKVPTLNDSISSANKDKVELNTTFKPPVTDLKKAIGFNDKFAFIKGLFNNSVESFESALKDLNACTNYNEANHYIEQQLASKYEWGIKPELKEQFTAIVKQRFNE
ncbi:hypothetical protein C3K47_03665 [Solitalea longa]|uniref:Uncharacterized protein n=1 Tax=Solitalea longa TaxID=2079460 RepID=A0A2S5A7L7_9SPHI|nr:hypothetical protein [Solitalea longa]POY38504.1 hypothetical protein C3K47_03665 [Solitalea longa]